MNSLRFLTASLILVLGISCQTSDQSESEMSQEKSENPFEVYLATDDPAFEWDVVASYPGEGYTSYIIRMVSQQWLTEEEVNDPVWWHWLTLVIPEEVNATTGLMFIGGGGRSTEQPEGDNELLIQAALATQSATAYLHNVPNQPTVFKGDDYGPRVEDELISYGWRKFLEGGAKDEDAIWLARLPMTKSVMRAMDVVTAFTVDSLDQQVNQFMVAGGSKRGWTTWTTAAMDDRVVAIAPLVIDMLNVIPSFEHHWQAYGRWADAVGDYEEEGIMEWQKSREYDRLLELTEPFSYKDRYQMPKFIINGAGDQFFLPDSWKFYWDELPGEKHIRYIPNTDHSLRNSDAMESLIAFYQNIVYGVPRPEFDWKVENGNLEIKTDPDNPPAAIKLWQAHNAEARNFQLKTIGEAYTASEVAINSEGTYSLKANSPDQGYTAFFAELTYDNGNGVPLKFTTGIVITPDTYPHDPFVSQAPMGTPR